MFELLMLSMQTPAVQAAPPPQSALPQATVGSLTLSQGHMMGWSRAGGLEGEIAFTVRNLGAVDRVLAVSTPAGPVGTISVQIVRDGEVVTLDPGDTTVTAVTGASPPTPGLSRVTATLTDLAHGSPSGVGTWVEVRFEQAGSVLLALSPASPAPPP